MSSTAASTLLIPTLRFSEVDAQEAYDAWGCNCGPAALAAILGRTLDEVRPSVEAVGFAEKRYISPRMMARAIAGCRWHHRIHAAWKIEGGMDDRPPGWYMIFDINSGLDDLLRHVAAPMQIMYKHCVPRGDGGWFIAQSWEIET